MLLLIAILTTVVLVMRRHRYRERGFEVQNIRVEGNEHLSREAILDLADVAGGERLLENERLAMRERLLEQVWIADVRIREVMGGTVVIAVRERVPVAILRRSEPSLLCMDGEVIPFDEAYADLPTVYVHGKMDLSSLTARIRMIRTVLGECPLTIHFKANESTYVSVDGMRLKIGSNEPLPLHGEVREAIGVMKEKGYRVCDMRFKDQIIFEKGGAL